MIKNILISLALALLPLVVISPVVQAAEEVLDPACQVDSNSPLCNRAGSSNPLFGPDGVINKAANLVSILVGIASVIMIIIGGTKYILSTGDPARVNSAKNTILYALIGLGIAIFAQVIIRFVLSQI
jgi:hypothetical protein